jgi:hypothetical protein
VFRKGDRRHIQRNDQSVRHDIGYVAVSHRSSPRKRKMEPPMNTDEHG